MSFGLYRPSLVPFMDSLKCSSRKQLLRLQTVKCEGKDSLGEVCIQSKWPIKPKLIPVEDLYSLLEGMLGLRSLLPA